MPQRRCCVFSCNSWKSQGAKLHAFPNPWSDSERFQTWVTNAGLVEEDVEYVYRNRRICHLHFEAIYQYPKDRLNRLAIPTLHLAGNALQKINLDMPLLSQPELAGSTLFAETISTDERNIFPTMLEDPQPSTSREIYIPVPSFVEPSALPQPTRQIMSFKTIQRKSLTRIEILLYEKVAKAQQLLNQCEKTKAGLKKKLKIANKLRHSAAYKLITKDLSPAAKTFFDMQTREAQKEPKGRRFTLDEKILALSLYKPSPKAYRLLSQICVLPKKSTLNKLMANISLSPGPNDIIFEHLKQRVEKMPTRHRYCVLIFDEMAISSNLSYDKNTDTIKGLADDGMCRTKSFADHVLVFMIRGILKKFKQPISFSFCTGTTKTLNLKQQIKIMIERITDTGLKVIATTCDQGSTNMAAINSLINDTRINYLRQDKEFRGGFFEISDTPIYAIFDPPHLLKGIRNNLLSKNLEYKLDKNTKVAKWSHIEMLYKKRPGYKGVRLLPKLTARHAIPHLIPKMKVKYCTQVFSKTVSVGMGITASYGSIPRESTDTADLLMFFDKLFDSVNGDFSKPRKGKVYRSAVTPKSPHWTLWRHSIPVLKSMKFLCTKGKRVVPSISSWIKTIEAFQQICKNLHSLGLRSLLLRNFNQDPLENFFGAIRAHGHANVMPNSAAFEASYKALIVTNMVSPKSVGTNCEKDDCYCLENLKQFLNSDRVRPLPVTPCQININDLYMPLTNVNELLKSQNAADLEKCAAAAYCSGWVISMIYKTISKDCEDCKKDLEGGSEEEYSLFINMKKNSEKSILHYPNKKLLECFIHMEEITIEILKNHCEAPQISNYITLVITTLISFNFIKCLRHKEKLSSVILEKSIIFFIRNWCKEIGDLLCGKSVIYDDNDGIKKLAHEHFINTKIKKRHRNVN